MMVSINLRGCKSIFIISLLITTGFIGILVFDEVLKDSTVQGATTRYVGGTGPGNFSSIQAAIDNASVGDTIYVWAGTYYENLIINKTISLIGNGSATTFIDGGFNDEIVYVTANWVNITGLKFMNGGASFNGINLHYVNNCSIDNNTITYSSNGIFLLGAKDNSITNNVFRYNTNAIILSSSIKNIVENNRCNLSNYNGIGLYDSTNNLIINNTCQENLNAGIYTFGLANANCLKNNQCNFNLHGIRYETANSGQVINNTCLNNTNGIYIESSNLVTVNFNNCSDNYYGIIVDFSFFDIFDSNICYNNFIGFYQLISRYNKIINSTFNRQTDSGIKLERSNINELINNTCSFNTVDGIYLDRS